MERSTGTPLVVVNHKTEAKHVQKLLPKQKCTRVPQINYDMNHQHSILIFDKHTRPIQRHSWLHDLHMTSK